VRSPELGTRTNARPESKPARHPAQDRQLPAGMTDRASRRAHTRTSVDLGRVGHSAAFSVEGCAVRGVDFGFARSATRQDTAREGNDTKLSNRSFHLQMNRRWWAIRFPGEQPFEGKRPRSARVGGLW
jgi:hypothetical protein